MNRYKQLFHILCDEVNVHELEFQLGSSERGKLSLRYSVFMEDLAIYLEGARQEISEAMLLKLCEAVLTR